MSVLFTSRVARADSTSQRLSHVSIKGVPVAPIPTGSVGAPLGVGLCAAFRPTPSPPPDALFPRRVNYPGPGVLMFAEAINDFMDGVTGGLSSGAVSYATLLKPFDLASQIPGLGQQSIGDFKFTKECPSDAGCPYPGANMTMPPQGAFGARFRGFLAVPPSWTGQFLHFGFATDLAVAMRFYVSPEKGQAPILYEVLSRADDGSSSQYRVTNSVSFPMAGLYAVEILHANTGSPGYLEMGVRLPNSLREYQDVDESIFVSPGASQLSQNDFMLALPDYFYQTVSGAPPFAGRTDQCQQCPRSWANQPNQKGQNICPSGMFCNQAAVCSPCIGDLFCGSACVSCEGDTPYCIRDPRSGATDYVCAQCNDEKGCKPGQQCVGGKCISPCLCCKGAPFCVVTDETQHGALNCSACAHDSDCAGGVCDRVNGRCVDKLPEYSKDTECGPNHVNCLIDTKPVPQDPASRPLRPRCMNGQVCAQCRYDADCADGTYCQSGDCLPCTSDRHCGPTCKGCGINLSINPGDGSVNRTTSDQPFCLSVDREVATASCVRCKEDSHCGPGGTCDPLTHQCQAACMTSCSAEQVECYTSSQCPCGQCVDGECTTSCGDSSDCRSNQCCTVSTGQCLDGRCKPGLTAHGGAPCCSATAGSLGGAAESADPTSLQSRLLWALLAAVGLWLAMRRTAVRTPKSAVPSRSVTSGLGGTSLRS